MVAFMAALDAGRSELEKIKHLTNNQNNVFLLVNGAGLIKIYHSPKNFGGTLLCPSHKVACLTGLGCLAICVQLTVASAFADCKMNTPTSEELAACTTAENVYVTFRSPMWIPMKKETLLTKVPTLCFLPHGSVIPS